MWGGNQVTHRLLEETELEADHRGAEPEGGGGGLEAAALAVGEEGLLALLGAGEERRQGGPRLRVLRVEADDAAQVGERLLLLLQV